MKSGILLLLKQPIGKFVLILTILMLFFQDTNATALKQSTTSISGLKVQNIVVPLAIEDSKPVFSWIMNSAVTGQKQTAFQIVVTNESNNSIVWDSKKVVSGLSDNILYNGDPLLPESAYSWSLIVWDAKGKKYTGSSRFETGLMDPDIKAWNGAQWIGSNTLTLDVASTLLFELKTDFRILPGSKTASVILGADDFRFNNPFQNIENIEGKNYVRFELDISGAGTPEGTILNIYRVGYVRGDSETIPYKVISLKTFPETNINSLITDANKYDTHNLSISVDAGNISIQIDGTALQTTAPAATPARAPGATGGGFGGGGTGFGRARVPSITISNYTTGNNYNSFPNLNSIGFACRPGDEVLFSNYTILNKGQSSPENNVLFGPSTAKNYSIFSKIPGISVDSSGKTIKIKNNTPETIIGYADPSHGSVTMLRRGFSTSAGKSISKAKMYATSMGAFEMFINGKRMGSDWFAPGSTQFRETIGYYAYDVTSLLRNGSNSVGAILSPGWYTGPMTFTPGNLNFFGDTEALLAKLVITYTDGSKETIVTDPQTWKLFRDGPIEYGTFFQGERYNALKEDAISVNGNVYGWTTSDYSDSNWKKAERVKQRDWIRFDITARYDQAVRVAETLTAKKVMDVHSADGHTYTYDMGVNMVGVPSVTIPAGWLKKGDLVIIRYGEQLYPGLPGDKTEYVEMYGAAGKNIAGRVLHETYRAALATDFYTAAGSKQIVIQPSTTYRGYQYIQISIPGHSGPLPLENVRGLVLSSDNLPSGTYSATTADTRTGELVSQLFRNIQRSQLGNFFTIPTDCPQRNERMGWTGDAQAYTRTGTYNSDARNFFRQWMVALRDDQGVGNEKEAPGGIGSTVPTFNKADATTFADGTTWAAAVCMVPWQLYIQYGDRQIIEENIEAMMLWLNGMDFYDLSEEYPHLSLKTSGLADWLAMDNSTPPQLVNNAIYIYMMEVTAIMAEAIGKNDYAKTLSERHAHAKAEWNKAYFDSASGKTKNIDGTIINSQASYATPLNFNVFSDENLKKAQDQLALLAADPSLSGKGDKVYPKYSITTGFSGTPNILPALSRAGKSAEAYNMISCTDYVSWLYPVTMGATSVWERWNGYEAAFGKNNQNSMNSFNHFALGAVGQWMYEFQLGITTDHASGAAGYKHFVLQPSAGGNYTSLEGSYTSHYGVIGSSWKADGKGTMTEYHALVPANTTATLYLPVNNESGSFRSVKGASFVKIIRRNNLIVAQYELLSGSFNFVIEQGGITVK